MSALRPPYLRRIEVLNNRVHPPFTIELQPREGKAFRHLILTGKNGSGKTSTLEAIWNGMGGDDALNGFFTLTALEAARRQGRPLPLNQPLACITVDESWTSENPQAGVLRIWSQCTPVPGRELDTSWLPALLVHLKARRDTHFQASPGPGVEDWHGLTTPRRAQAERLIQFFVNRQTERAFALADGDQARADAVGAWFAQVEGVLGKLLESAGLKLEFQRKDYSFKLLYADGTRLDLNTLPDGFKSLLEIWSEIALRYEALRKLLPEGEEPRGIVLIDEPESHLHLTLQDSILPTLTTFFPTVQFVVATHSPAVIGSIDDALVYDLSTQRGTPSEALRGRRYGDLVTGHFGLPSDFDEQSSTELARLTELWAMPQRDAAQEGELAQLAARLCERSPSLAAEVWTRTEGRWPEDAA